MYVRGPMHGHSIRNLHQLEFMPVINDAVQEVCPSSVQSHGTSESVSKKF